MRIDAMGTGWGSVTPAKPMPMMQAQWVLYMLLAQWVFSIAQQILGGNADGRPSYCTVPVVLIHKKKNALQKYIHICQNHIPNLCQQILLRPLALINVNF